MNDNQSPSESGANRPHTNGRRRFLDGRRALVLLFLMVGTLTIFLTWLWFKASPRSPALLAADRQRLEAFLAVHDYEAFLRLMELQPPAVRAELPAEWLRRYDEIKPALLFTVREASTEDVINSEEKYEAPLLSLRWSDGGKYLVDVLDPPSKRKVFDGKTGRLVSVSKQPKLLAETDAHWPLGQFKRDTRPKYVDEQLAKRLCFSFGHDPAFWQAQKEHLVLVMPTVDSTQMLTSFAVDPEMVERLKNNFNPLAGGRIQFTLQEGNEQIVNAQKRCFNVWKAKAFPE